MAPSPTWNFGGGVRVQPDPGDRARAPGGRQVGDPRGATHDTATAGFDSPRWVSAGIEARHVGARFDDDLNEVKLDGFYLVGVRVNRAIGRGLTAHVKVENLARRGVRDRAHARGTGRHGRAAMDHRRDPCRMVSAP